MALVAGTNMQDIVVRITPIAFLIAVQFLLRVVGVLVHEMGHLIVGLALFPGESFDVYFGSHGERRKGSISFQISSVTFYVRVNPVLFLGGLAVRKAPRSFTLRSNALFILGGPLAELVLGLVSIVGFLMPMPDAVRVVLFAIGCSSLFGFVVNLYPFEMTVKGGMRVMASDGQRLMALYRMHKTRYGPYLGVKFWK